MGCDIYMYCEYKHQHGKDKPKWVSADHYRVNPHFGRYEDEARYEIVELYGNRWYELFSILADVRNYSGNKPISEPKGIPSDSCIQIVEEYGDGCGDWHSASYFTLKELLDVQPNYKTSKRSGMISPIAYENLKNGITPDEWCQGTNREDYVYAEWTEDSDPLEAIITPLINRAREVFIIYDFYSEDRVKEEIDKIADDIRIVFWFDN